MKQIIEDIFGNHLLLAPLISWFAAQLLKVFTHLVIDRKFSLDRLFGDGGMPSGHSATVTSLAVIVGWSYGFDSAVFAIATLLAIIVMHDATGVRREAGKHAESIKEMAELFNELFKESDIRIRTEKIKKLVGHTPLQVFVGALIGTLIAVIVCCALNISYKGI